MTENSRINLLYRKGAYGTSNTYELTRIGLALAAMDVPVRAIFEQNSVLCFTKNQKPEGIGSKSIANFLTFLADYDVEIYFVKEAIEELGLETSDFLDSIDYDLIPRYEIGKLIQGAKFTFEV